MMRIRYEHRVDVGRTGVTVNALADAFARLRSSGRLVRLGMGCAVGLSSLITLNHGNPFVSGHVHEAFGLPFDREIGAAAVLGRSGGASAPSFVGSLMATWKPPRDLPTSGEVVEVDIPGVVSGFTARPAWLYLPPAYLSARRPRLPVLELIGGQPGNSSDWLDEADLAGVMDRYASTHHGLAPVVVMPDALGSYLANPMCINSQLGQSKTYLTVDVPNWVRTHLHVHRHTATWAVGGGSFGGTCAWQLAVYDPKLFPTLIDISGMDEQLWGTLQDTIDIAFGGNAREFAKVNPAQILIKHKRPNTRAILAVGSDDPYYKQKMESVAAICRRAGMHVRWREVPGGHDGAVFSMVLAHSMNWLSRRDGIT